MDLGYEREAFATLKIKSSIAKKFKKFCGQMSASQSMTLHMMLEFFENNGISPKESLGPKIQTLEHLIKKRVNGLVAIIKNIEQTQNKPLLAMMQSLFAEVALPKQELWLERKPENVPIAEDHKLQSIKLQMEILELKRELTTRKADMQMILENVEHVKNNFGKSYLRLNLGLDQLESLKKKVDHT